MDADKIIESFFDDAFRQFPEEDEPTRTPVGPPPVPRQGPRCHFCGDHRRLVPNLVALKDGRDVRLCATCARQVEWDRAKRCVVCAEPSKRRLVDGVCIGCRGRIEGAPVNLVRLVRRRWLGVIDEA